VLGEVGLAEQAGQGFVDEPVGEHPPAGLLVLGSAGVRADEPRDVGLEDLPVGVVEAVVPADQERREHRRRALRMVAPRFAGDVRDGFHDARLDRVGCLRRVV
jgi:hypothetical protein